MFIAGTAIMPFRLSRTLRLNVAAALLAVIFSSRAYPCSPVKIGPPHVLDPAQQATDVQAPGTPEIGAIEVTPFQPFDEGCGLSQSACGGGRGIRWVNIPLTARDDRTPAVALGYRLTSDANQPFFSPTGGTVRATDGVISIPISHDQPLSFKLTIETVDLAGNVSAAGATAQVSDPGSSEGGGGCRVASRGGGRRSNGTVILAALVLAAAWLWRGRGRDRGRRRLPEASQ
jgi:hypothetical protein